MFQFFHLIPRLTAAANIELPMMLAGIPEHERKQRVQNVLKAIDLENRAEHRPDQLSGGQLQRIAIARATIMQPKILLADEPTGNLDSRTTVEIMELFDELHSEGHTLILVTHENEIAKHCHRIVEMKDGLIFNDQFKAA